MFIKLRGKNGQTIGEFAILMGIIVAATIAMQVYIRRGVQARIKDTYDYVRQVNYTADSGGDQTFSGMFSTNQYEPTFLESSLKTLQNGTRNVQMKQGGGLMTNISQEVTQRTGSTNYTFP